MPFKVSRIFSASLRPEVAKVPAAFIASPKPAAVSVTASLAALEKSLTCSSEKPRPSSINLPALISLALFQPPAFIWPIVEFQNLLPILAPRSIRLLVSLEIVVIPAISKALKDFSAFLAEAIIGVKSTSLAPSKLFNDLFKSSIDLSDF